MDERMALVRIDTVGCLKKAVDLLAAVLLAVVILVVIGIFVPHHSHEKARQETCLSQLRQLATAIQMYEQDNSGRLPGADWVNDISNYVGGSTKMFFCPSDAALDKQTPVSYGYSGLLLRADGSGVNEKQISAPADVGVLCDAYPSPPFPHGGIVSGGGLLPAARVVTPSSRHTKGTMMAYADGHAKFIPTEFDEKNLSLSHGITRAFYLANTLRLIDNPVGGMSVFTPRVIGKGPVAIGGENCTAPLLRAAADAWGQKTQVKVTNCGFAGQYAVGKRPAACVWGTGDGMRPAGNTVAIARDAVVVIIAKKNKIHHMLVGNKQSSMTYDAIRRLFGSSGYSANVYQVYTYNRNSGTTAFFTRAFGEDGKPLAIGSRALIVKNDWEMVGKVANDPYAIGYCSAAMADLDRVTIVDLQLPSGRIAHYPQNDPQHRWTVSAHPTWPLMRTLYAISTLPKSNHFVDEMLAPGSPGVRALRAGPLFKASYYLPVP